MSRTVIAVLAALALIVALFFLADPLGLFSDEIVRREEASGGDDDLLEDPTLAGRRGAAPATPRTYLTNEPVGVLDLGLGTAALHGLVTGDGAPLQAARVHVVLPPPAGLRGVRTTEDGSWEIRGLPAGAHEVRASHPAYVGRTVVASAVPEGGGVEVEPIDLQRRTAHENGFHVRVTDEFGRPIAGARVIASTLLWGLHLTLGPELAGVPGVMEKRGVTDESGEARLLELTPEKYDVVAVAPGYQLAAQPSVVLASGLIRHLHFRLQPGASITGHVVGPDDSPVGGAFVTGLYLQTFEIALAVRSAEDGSFVLEGLRKGSYWLISGHDQHGEGQVNPVKSPSSGVRVRLSGAGRVETVVRRPDGAPVSRYRVRPYKPEPYGYTYSPVINVEDEEGKGSFDLGPGTYNLVVFGEEGDVAKEVTARVVVGETARVEVVLPTTSTLSGVIVDPDGRHLEGAEIYVRMGGMPGGPRREQYARADEDGAFRLTGLPAEMVKLHAEHVGFAPTVVEFDLKSGEVPPDLTVRLGRGGTVEGRVTRGGDTPAVGEQVNVSKDFFNPLTTTTDEQGNYRIEGLGPEAWTVSTGTFGWGGGGASRSGVMVPDGGVVRVDLDLVQVEGLGVVTGTVIRGGEPVEGATVSVIDGRGYDSLVSVSTDAGGAFRAEGIQPGRAQVQVLTPEGARSTQRVDVPAEGEAPSLRIELGTGSVRGLLVMLDGTPVSAAWIQVEEVSPGDGDVWGRVRAQITSGPEGVFRAEGLEPGIYQVRVSGSGHAGLLTEPFEVGTGATVDLGTYRLATGVSLSGRLVDDEGAPVEDATISMRDDSGRPVFLFSLVTTGSDGRYAVTGLEPGRYVVGFEAKGYAPATRGIELGAEGATVDGVLSKGGSVEVEVRDEAGVPIPGIRVGLVDGSGRVVDRTLSLVSIFQGEIGRTGEDGLARVPDLAPGTYTLTVRSDGWRRVGPAPVVTVSSRQVTTTVMVLQRE